MKHEKLKTHRIFSEINSVFVYNNYSNQVYSDLQLACKKKLK